MPLPASGAVRLGADVDVILGFSSTTQISLGATGVRTLYGVASGAIRLAADGYGKSPAAVQYNLNSSMIMVNSFTLYFVSTIDADAAYSAMTSGKVFTLWDASSGKYTGTLSSTPGSHSPGNNTVYHSFSSTPAYKVDVSGTTNRIQIG